MVSHHSLIALTIQFLLVIAATAAQAADWRFGHVDPNSTGPANVVVLTGEIQRGDYENLLKFATQDRRLFAGRMFVLASPGGDLVEAMRIGELLRSIYASVFVNPRVGTCASACFMIYAAAVERDAVPPGLGVHRPYFLPAYFRNLSVGEAEGMHRQLTRSVRAYLERQEVPTHIVERMFSMASTELYTLSYADLAALGRRANWWDQLLIERCKLDKALEDEYLRLGQRSPRAALAREHIARVASCAYEVSANERERALTRALSPNAQR